MLKIVRKIIKEEGGVKFDIPMIAFEVIVLVGLLLSGINIINNDNTSFDTDYKFSS